MSRPHGRGCHFFTYARDPRSESFNNGWKFMLADSAHYKDSSYDDSHWRSLSLPTTGLLKAIFPSQTPQAPAAEHFRAEWDGIARLLLLTIFRNVAI